MYILYVPVIFLFIFIVAVIISFILTLFSDEYLKFVYTCVYTKDAMTYVVLLYALYSFKNEMS